MGFQQPPHRPSQPPHDMAVGGVSWIQQMMAFQAQHQQRTVQQQQFQQVAGDVMHPGMHGMRRHPSQMGMMGLLPGHGGAPLSSRHQEGSHQFLDTMGRLRQEWLSPRAHTPAEVGQNSPLNRPSHAHHQQFYGGNLQASPEEARRDNLTFNQDHVRSPSATPAA